MARSRWRPICPECGYSLRMTAVDRCPECGGPYPTSARRFRRWAVRRLPWDRLQRTSRPGDYLKTLAIIALTPWRAGRRIAIPDRWPRAVRWAAAHLLLAIVLGLALCDNLLYTRWVLDGLHPPPPYHPVYYMAERPSAGRVLTWFVQSCAAWVITLVIPVIVGVLICVLYPGRHRAWKRTGAKWALYAAAVIPLTLACDYAWRLWPFTNLHFGDATWVYKVAATPAVPVDRTTLTYGVWWAIGMAANRYGRKYRRPPRPDSAAGSPSAPVWRTRRYHWERGWVAFGYYVLFGVLYSLSRLVLDPWNVLGTLR